MLEIKLVKRIKYAGDVHKALLALGWDIETAAAFCDRIPDAVDAVEVKAIQRLLSSECARLYRADEEMIKNMGGYNPSSFMAGYQYALDCIIGKFTQIKGERETDGRISFGVKKLEEKIVNIKITEEHK